MTKIDQMPAPVYMIFLDFSHSPGEANVTGIRTTKTIDRRISPKTSNCTAIAIDFLFIMNLLITKDAS